MFTSPELTTPDAGPPSPDAGPPAGVEPSEPVNQPIQPTGETADGGRDDHHGQSRPQNASPHEPGNPFSPTFAEPAPRHEVGVEWAPRQISAEEVLSRTWAIFKEQWLMICVAMVIVAAVNIGISIVQNVGAAVLENVVNEDLVTAAFRMFMALLTWVVGFWLQIGQSMVMLDVARGRRIEVGKIFAGGPFLLNVLIAGVIVSLILGLIAGLLIGLPAGAIALIAGQREAAVVGAIIGLAIAAAPMLIVWFMFSQSTMLIIDRRLNAMDALRVSAEITRGNKITLLLIFVMLALIGTAATIVGLLLFCVGFFPAIIAVSGFSTLALVIAYLLMTGQAVIMPYHRAAPGSVA